MADGAAQLVAGAIEVLGRHFRWAAAHRHAADYLRGAPSVRLAISSASLLQEAYPLPTQRSSA